jgi:hypothetical protein
MADSRGTAVSVRGLEDRGSSRDRVHASCPVGTQRLCSGMVLGVDGTLGGLGVEAEGS